MLGGSVILLAKSKYMIYQDTAMQSKDKLTKLSTIMKDLPKIIPNIPILLFEKFMFKVSNLMTIKEM